MGGRSGREEGLKAGLRRTCGEGEEGGWGGTTRGKGNKVVGGGEDPLCNSSGGARVWTHSATSVTEEVCLAPPSVVYRRVGANPSGLEVGAGWVEVALARRQKMGRADLDDPA